MAPPIALGLKAQLRVSLCRFFHSSDKPTVTNWVWKLHTLQCLEWRSRLVSRSAMGPLAPRSSSESRSGPPVSVVVAHEKVGVNVCPYIPLPYTSQPIRTLLPCYSRLKKSIIHFGTYVFRREQYCPSNSYTLYCHQSWNVFENYENYFILRHWVNK